MRVHRKVLKNLNQPYEYVGREGYYREEFDLYLLGVRWYDSDVGRFISRDLIEKNILNLIEEVLKIFENVQLITEDGRILINNKQFLQIFKIFKNYSKTFNYKNLNLYRYCSNNPSFFIDPDGEINIPAIICLTAAIIDLINQILWPWIISKNPELEKSFPQPTPSPPNPNFPPYRQPPLLTPITAPPSFY